MPLSKDEEKRAKEISDRVAKLKGYKTNSTKVGSLSALESRYNPKPIETTVYESPEAIASKLNRLDGAIESHVIKDLPTKEDFLTYVKNLKGNDRIDISNIRNGNFNMSDQRWHGGGGSASNITGLISAGTNVTITGTGTSGDPYVINSSGGGGSGTVTSVSVVTANGISGSVATATTTPAITLDITALNATKIADGSVSNTEFQYLDGVTSNIQTQLNAKGSGTVTSVGTGTGLTGGAITTTGTISLANTAVTPGSYTNANITVDQQGRITSASNGSAGSITGGGTLGQVTYWNGASSITGDANFLWDVGGADLTLSSNLILSGDDSGIATIVADTSGLIISTANHTIQIENAHASINIIQTTGEIELLSGTTGVLLQTDAFGATLTTALLTGFKNIAFPNASGTIALQTGQTYTVSNVTPDRTFNPLSTNQDEIAMVLATLIQDLAGKVNN